MHTPSTSLANAGPPVRRAGTTLSYLVQVLLRGKWLLIGALAVTVGGAVAYLAVTEPVYEAGSSLVVQEDARAQRELDVVRALGLGGNRDVLVEAEVLRSFDLAQRVAGRLLALGDATLPVLQDKETGGVLSDPVRLARRLNDQVRVEQPRRDVNVLSVIFESTSPREAALVANLFAEEYEVRHEEQARLRTADMRAFLDEQMTTRKAMLDEAEVALRRYRESAGAVNLDEQSIALIQQLSAVESTRDAAQVELAAAQTLLASYEQELENYTPGVAARLASGIDRTIEKLQDEVATKEAERQTILARNPDATEHERVEKLNREIAALRADVDQRVAQYVSELDASGGLGTGADVAKHVTDLRRTLVDQRVKVNELQAQIATLDGRLGQYRGSFRRLPAQQSQIAALERQKQTQEQFYQYLRAKWEEARIAEASRLAAVTVLDRAIEPVEPVRPGRVKLLVLSLLLGMMIGGVLAFVREMQDDKVRRPEDVQYLGLPLVGVVPDFGMAAATAERAAHRGNASPFIFTLHQPFGEEAGAFHRMVAPLEFAPAAASQPVLLVASPRSGAGKSVAAANLAAALALSGRRTLLLDANLRRPAAARMLDVPVAPGIVEVLEGSARLNDALQRTDVPNLLVLPAGQLVNDPATVLFSRHFEHLIAHLRRSFDRVVIDGGALLEGGDTLTLAALADRTLVLFPSGQTPADDALQAMQMLLRVQSREHLAAALTDFHARRTYGYWREAGYEGHYGKRAALRGKSAATPQARLLLPPMTLPPEEKTPAWQPLATDLRAPVPDDEAPLIRWHPAPEATRDATWL